MNPQKRRQIHERIRAANPNPTTELKYRTPYELLIAVRISAQTTDKLGNKATEVLFQKYDTPQKIVKLGVAGLEQYIKTIGLYRNKAKNVVELSRILVEKHGGEVPATREALEELPGVGRKTANVVLNTAFGQPTVAVDTHIFRVAHRTGLAPGKGAPGVPRGARPARAPPRPGLRRRGQPLPAHEPAHGARGAALDRPATGHRRPIRRPPRAHGRAA